jgi:hypothetical protein
MMSEGQPSPAPPGRVWRTSSSDASPAAKSAGGAQRAGARGWKKFVLLATILALCGIILAWFLMLTGFTEPYFLAIPITEYRDRGLPRNAWAKEDCEMLLKLFREGHRADAFNFQERSQLKGVLDGLRERKDEKSPVVVYLSALAVYCDGDVSILPGDAELKKPGGWLALADVVKNLRKCKSSHRLLILDIMQHRIANACPDVADNDSAKADNEVAKPDDDIAKHVHNYLNSELNKAEEPSLRVLCACGPGQVSRPFQEKGHSLFAYFIAKGLQGEAVNFKGKRNDRYVSVDDLAAFVVDRVDGWAKKNGGFRQTPALLGKGEDFYLAMPSR